MLLTRDLIKDIEDKELVSMLKQVSIPDFTKCIAQFSGLEMNDVKEEVIKRYLLTWAENKKEIFKMLGNRTREDHKIFFKKTFSANEIDAAVKNLALDFPGYTPWLLQIVSRSAKNEQIHIDEGQMRRSWLPAMGTTYEKVEGKMSITHFFSKVLKAPQELVTAIAALYENNEITSMYTLSIDPVDMMLASENPYDWKSCYNLGVGDNASHADGCLAAVLDSSEAIAYIWDREGKFILHNHYTFSSIRYKRIRQWISFSSDFCSIHFNDIYPGRNSYGEDFEKLMREQVETLIEGYTGVKNVWRKANYGWTQRKHCYGYGEFGRGVYTVLSEIEEGEKIDKLGKIGWEVYDELLECPCGCGEFLIPSDDCGDEYEWDYTGEGFNHCSFYQKDLCPYSGDFCSYAGDCNECTCGDCWAWRDNHPLCRITDEVCTAAEDLDDVEDDEGYIRMCDGNCSECLTYKEYKEDIRREQEQED